ncbi:MAG: response regulator transcription factor [Geminicoccaceae bacterium]
MNAVTDPMIHIVDDDDAVRDSLKTLLESYGMAVRDYASAAEFLGNLDPRQRGCLILDLHLPILGGLDLIKIMREQRIPLPVVFITGRSDKETKARALEAGAVAFLDKPVPEESLTAAIRLALKAAADAASGAAASSAAERLAPSPS